MPFGFLKPEFYGIGRVQPSELSQEMGAGWTLLRWILSEDQGRSDVGQTTGVRRGMARLNLGIRDLRKSRLGENGQHQAGKCN